jgi:hypothetical protein
MSYQTLPLHLLYRSSFQMQGFLHLLLLSARRPESDQMSPHPYKPDSGEVYTILNHFYGIVNRTSLDFTHITIQHFLPNIQNLCEFLLNPTSFVYRVG